MKLKGPVLTFKDYLVFLFIVLLAAGLIACGDDGDDDDDDDDGASSSWVSITDDEGVIKIDTPRSWHTDNSCERDQDSGDVVFCEIVASPEIEHFWTQWDGDAVDGIYVFIGTRDFLVADSGISNNESALAAFQTAFNHKNNCDLNGAESGNTDDGGLVSYERFHHCGQSDARAMTMVKTLKGGNVIWGIFAKSVTLTEDERDQLIKSVTFNDK